MNRTRYYNYIEEKLNFLAYRIEKRGKINLLDLNIHSETFFAELFNILYNYNLVNLNSIKQNVEGIDLIDTKNKVIIQVSATCTKEKIENSLNKVIYLFYQGYNFKFISISKEVSNKLRAIEFKNPYNLIFNSQEDILDSTKLLGYILSLGIDKQKVLFEFIKKELEEEINIVKVDSNLATIINILAEEDLDLKNTKINTTTFVIEDKINYNDLNGVRELINDYKIFSVKLDQKYTEFDREGINRSTSILQIIRRQYIKLRNEKKDSEEVFYGVVENIMKIIEESSNYRVLPFEELEICVDILVVDAFMRCKIFENPEENK
ncbi:SMEK domain-containing protein [Fusobacterium polymorphum]|uniref:ABC-three component system protein n=1 Tax=Fusobacterium nucleatum subsp. polymorphum TaxID=76857 RepID=UPI0020C1B186|nr:ABC-three component system protein [Fusobacterium polymorphum]UTI52717.1 SMEK domain-containing protein [Fusobacterium polymorphum]